MAVKAFTGGEVARLTGVPYSCVNRWANNGLLVPSIAAAAGKTTSRLYSFGDAVALVVVSRVREALGVEPHATAPVVEYLRGLDLDAVRDGQLLAVGQGPTVELVDASNAGFVAAGGVAMLIDLLSLVDELVQRLGADKEQELLPLAG